MTGSKLLVYFFKFSRRIGGAQFHWFPYTKAKISGLEFLA